MAQRLYIDLGSDPHQPRAATSGAASPGLSGILGTQVDVIVGYFRDETPEALPAGTTGGKLTLKKSDDLAGAAVLLDLAWEVVGTGSGTTYKFSGPLDSDELVAALGIEKQIVLAGNVEWLLSGAPRPSKCEDFEFTLKNSSSRPADTIPATTDTRWAWLKAAAPEANGFAHDDNAKTLTVDAGGAVDSVNGQTGVVVVTKSDVGLGNCDNTADSAKPVSTAQQAALDLKAPLTSPALTGTPTAPTAADGTNSTQVATTAFAAALGALKLAKANNLSDLPSAATARSNLGIGAVNNTSDINKPVSDATNIALNARVPTTRAVNVSGLVNGGGQLTGDITINVTAATQEQAEAGTLSNVVMTPLRTAQAIAALAPGGGTAIEIETTAWVEADGNDGTAVMGDPSHPYLTMLAAYTAGARTFHVGVGTFAGITTTGEINVNIIGSGQTRTTITQIISTNHAIVVVRDLGRYTFLLSQAGNQVNNGITAEPGGNGGAVTLENVKVTDVYTTAGSGGASDETAPAPNGGTGGQATLKRCWVTGFINTQGGAGGPAVDYAGGNGGASGDVLAEDCIIETIYAGGAGGGVSTNSSNGGGGTGGTVTLTRAQVATLTIGAEMAGTAGALVGMHSQVTALLSSPNGGTEGAISGAFIFLGAQADAGVPTVSAHASYLSGTWVP